LDGKTGLNMSPGRSTQKRLIDERASNFHESSIGTMTFPQALSDWADECPNPTNEGVIL
jgi:hypothetical protein